MRDGAALKDGAASFRACMDRLARDLSELVEHAVAEEVERLVAERAVKAEAQATVRRSTSNQRRGQRRRIPTDAEAGAASASPDAGRESMRHPSRRGKRSSVEAASEGLPAEPPAAPLFVHRRSRDGAIVNLRRRAS